MPKCDTCVRVFLSNVSLKTQKTEGMQIIWRNTHDIDNVVENGNLNRSFMNRESRNTDHIATERVCLCVFLL